jgi:hypothetical protein
MNTTVLKRLLLLALIASSISVYADPPKLRQLFMSLPNSILALDSAHRSDLMAYYFDKKVDSVPNVMNGYTRILTWDEHEHHFVLETSKMGIFELQVFKNDQSYFIAVDKTVCAPASLSSISFYSLDWEKMPLQEPEVQLSDFVKTSLSADEMDQVAGLMTPLFVRFSFDASKSLIVATCDQKSFLSEDGWQHLQPYLKTTQLYFVFQHGQWVRQTP